MNSLSSIFALFDNLPQGYCVFDAQWKIMFWNQSLETWSGLRKDDVLKKSMKELFPVLERPLYRDRINQVIKTGNPAIFSSLLHRYFIPCPTTEGGYQTHQYYLTTMDADKAGERCCVLMVENLSKSVKVIEEYRAICRQLKLDEIKAQESMRAKSLFLAVMSHEIRTPLNGILGTVALLQHSPRISEDREYLETIRISGENLLSVVNNVLDFSKLDAGKLEIEEVEFDLRQLIEETMSMLAPMAKEKQLLLSNMSDQLIPSRVIGDPGKVRQILINYLSNALKFTDKGEILLRLHRVNDELSSHKIRIEVIDTGPGIAKDRLERMFKPYSQAQSSVSRRYGGTGLGLMICKGLAEALGGDVGVESGKEGSRFWFTVRLKWNPWTRLRERPNYEGKHFAIVGLHDLWLIRVRDLLYLRGIGSVQCLRPQDDEKMQQKYDILLIDQAVLDAEGQGLEAWCELKGIKASSKIVVLQADLSSTVTEEKKFECWRMPAPVRQAELYRSLERVFWSQLHPVSSPMQADYSSIQTVLVAEDNSLNQKVIRGMLEKLGITALVVNNGKEAVEQCQKQRFGLIFMDCEMPEMDGLEASRQIRSFCATPIIAVTANALPGDQERCLAAGMNHYLTKPLTMAKLKEVISHFAQTFAQAS